MNGSKSAISTALPRIRAARVTCNGVLTAIPVPLSIKTRISATMWSATKKKIVGGSSASNSSFSFVESLLMLRLIRRVFRTLDDRYVMVTTTMPLSASWLTVVPPSGSMSTTGNPPGGPAAAGTAETAPGTAPGAADNRSLVTRRHRNSDALLLEHLPDVLEPLVLLQGDRARVPLALQLARRVLHVGLHEVLDR